MPPSVASGSATARSGTTLAPSRPPARRNAVRPSLVMPRTRTATLPYAAGFAGSKSPRRNGWPVAPTTRSVPPRWRAPPARTPVQRAPPTSASPCGRFPIVNVRTITPRRGSMRATVPAYWLLTHTAPFPTATAASPSPAPNATVRATPLRRGSISDTVPASGLATHTAPSPNASALTPAPTRVLPTTRPSCVLISVTVPPDSLLAQTAPPPHASSVGGIVQPDQARAQAGARVDPQNSAIVAVGHPHSTAADAHTTGAVAHGDRLHDLVGVGRDPRERSVECVDDPYATPAGRDRLRRAAHPDRLADGASGPVEPRDGPIIGVRDPHSPFPDSHMRWRGADRDLRRERGIVWIDHRHRVGGDRGGRRLAPRPRQQQRAAAEQAGERDHGRAHQQPTRAPPIGRPSARRLRLSLCRQR